MNRKMNISKTGEDFRAYSGEYNVFDLDEAKSEWSKAKDVVVDGVTLSLIIKDTDTDKRVGEYIQSQLQENLEGLTIDLKPQPAANVNQLRKDKDYELSLWLDCWKQRDQFLFQPVQDRIVL